MVESIKQREDNSSSISYYRNIEDELKKGFATDEDKELFLGNVFEELTGDLSTAATHIKTSFVIQKLVRLASRDQLHQVLEATLKNFELLVVDRYANFVLETILYKATEFFDEGEDNSVMDMVYRFGMMLLERTDLLSHANASFSFRALVEVMSGIKVSDKKPWKPKKHRLMVCDMKEHNYYSKFSQLLHAFSSYVLPMSSSSIGMVDDVATSVLGQQLLYIFHEKEPKHCSQVCQKIIDGGLLQNRDRNGIPSLFLSHGGACFCEMLLKGLAKVPLGKFIKEFIAPNFDFLSTHRSGNFVVQAAISNLKSDIQFNTFHKCLQGKLFYWLSPEVNRAGIVSKFCQSAVGEPSREATIMQMWKDEMSESKINFVIAICLGSTGHNFTQDALSKKVVELTTLYSLVLQALFKYEDTTYLCSSLQRLPLKVKYALVQSLAGSFIIDAMLDSPTVPVSAKNDFINSLQSLFAQLVMHKSGSKVFERFWQLMSVPTQTEVLGLLADSVSAIMGTLYGKCVAANVHLQDFIHNREKWDKWIVEENKARKLKKTASKMTRSDRKKKRESLEASAEEQTTPMVKKSKPGANKGEEGIMPQESNPTKNATPVKVAASPTKAKKAASAKKSAKKVQESMDVSTPVKATSSPATSVKKSAKKAVKSAPATPVASVKKSAKKTPKSANKLKG